MKHIDNYERFLLVELDLAITFCQTGFLVRDRIVAEQSAENARKALDTVERMVSRTGRKKVVQAAIFEKFAAASVLVSTLERYLTGDEVAGSLNASARKFRSAV